MGGNYLISRGRGMLASLLFLGDDENEQVSFELLGVDEIHVRSSSDRAQHGDGG